MAGSHSRLAPSSAHRWMKCGQSVVPVVGAGVEEDSDASREGTAAHKLGEICLGSEEDAWQLIGKRFEGVEVTQEMAARVQVRLDYVRGRIEFYGVNCRHWCERKLTHEEFHPEFGGTVDDLLIDNWGECEIVDYKDGYITVDPEHNPQLLSYAWAAALKNSGLARFKLTVIQPKNETNPIRSWEISREELELWAYMELLPAMEKAGTGEYVMGEHCKYCPRLKALQCPAHTQVLEDLRGGLEDDLSENVSAVSGEQLAQYKDGFKVVERFMKAVDDELSRRLLTLGQSVPGWKVVEKKADRIWKDYASTVEWPVEFYTKPELMSPAKVEKLPGGAVMVAEHAYKPKAGLTIAPEADKRMAVTVGATYENVV